MEILIVDPLFTSEEMFERDGVSLDEVNHRFFFDDDFNVWNLGTCGPVYAVV